MKSFPAYVVCLTILISCGSHPPRGNAAGATDSSRRPKDSPIADDGNASKQFSIADYQRYAIRHVGNHTITLLKYEHQDEIDAMLLLKDDRSGKTDTLLLEGIGALGEPDLFAVRDISKLVGGPKPSFLVDWQGDSDNIYEKLIGYENDRLKELVDLPIVGTLRDLKRIDDHTLEGTYRERDVLLGYPRNGYRLRISLSDYATAQIEPDTLIFNDDTETRDSIRTTRILSGSPEGIPYTILPGTPVHIDTFFRKMRIVRFHIGDSIFLRAPQEDVDGKFKGDVAG